jgi:hypothetical protein
MNEADVDELWMNEINYAREGLHQVPSQLCSKRTSPLLVCAIANLHDVQTGLRANFGGSLQLAMN